MKLQVMPVTNAVLQNRLEGRNEEFIAPKMASVPVKAEPVEGSEPAAPIDPESSGTTHSHHRKIMMEKWMNIQDGVFEKRPVSPHNRDEKDVRLTRSPPTSPVKLNLNLVPPDPRKWTAEHVVKWLEAIELKHSFRVDRSDFKMNGRALCLMKREGFLHRVPEKGMILYMDFRTRLRQYINACRKRIRTSVLSPNDVAVLSQRFPQTAGTDSKDEPSQRRYAASQGDFLSPVGSTPHEAVNGNSHFGRLSNGVGLTKENSPEFRTSGPQINLSRTSGAAERTAAIPNGPFHPHRSLSNPGLSNHAAAAGSPATLTSYPAAWQHMASGLSNFSASKTQSVAPSTNSVAVVDGKVYPLYYPPAGMYPATSSAADRIHSNTGNGTSATRFDERPVVSQPPHHGLYNASTSSLASNSTYRGHTSKSTSNDNTPAAQSTDSCSSCPRHGILPGTGTLASPPYSYYNGQHFMKSLPFYQFVPLYRSMKIYGKFLPITYNYRLPRAPFPAFPAGMKDIPELHINTQKLNSIPTHVSNANATNEAMKVLPNNVYDTARHADYRTDLGSASNSSESRSVYRPNMLPRNAAKSHPSTFIPRNGTHTENPEVLKRHSSNEEMMHSATSRLSHTVSSIESRDVGREERYRFLPGAGPSRTLSQTKPESSHPSFRNVPHTLESDMAASNSHQGMSENRRPERSPSPPREPERKPPFETLQKNADQMQALDLSMPARPRESWTPPPRKSSPPRPAPDADDDDAFDPRKRVKTEPLSE